MALELGVHRGPPWALQGVRPDHGRFHTHARGVGQLTSSSRKVAGSRTRAWSQEQTRSSCLMLMGAHITA
eukprot:3264781-Pyramimonas_sp.AAC.1